MAKKKNHGSAPPVHAVAIAVVAKLTPYSTVSSATAKTRYFPMRDEMIALCVIDQNRLYWKPSPKFATVFGMRTIDCGPADDDVSYENARDQFRKAREIKKADRETRLLAKADRIRAAME
jgi:hypothetical protein